MAMWQGGRTAGQVQVCGMQICGVQVASKEILVGTRHGSAIWGAYEETGGRLLLVGSCMTSMYLSWSLLWAGEAGVRAGRT